ncbi:sensor histidine kinase [Mycobacterium sp. MYCO198283]|uniref:sensor histidine kinase n=1 Tax=Mycobacterium sp. MYCO198283 TaxID=2883505 RepID=UPI001E3D843B|nr:sensor histidine kinase [Mycobacterium sp. MYCO198283]MCG5430710.1 sensor histidine kinase [Mycobacterium sp. MYCO198283]
MVAVLPDTAPPPPVTPPRRRFGGHLGVLPTASLVCGAVIGVLWLWIPITILVAGLSSILSLVGFLVAAVVFAYLMRGVEHAERVRSEAVFGMGIAVPVRKRTPFDGFKGWAHQLLLDYSSARFWKACAHHLLRALYDTAAVAVAVALLAFAFLAPPAAIAVSRSDQAAGLRFLPTPLAVLLAVVALAAAIAILVIAPALDAVIDRWLLSPSRTAALESEVTALADARAGAVTSAQQERSRIERDLHDGVQPRLVSLAMTIGLARTKFDDDPAAAKALIGEAHDDAKAALAELRNVVRGIAPTILADRGLDAALSAVVQRAQNSGVPTTLHLELPRRLPEEVEACAYFVVAEALTNVARHAGASTAVVTVRHDQTTDRLHVSVFDDGRGGAVIAADGADATGLRGLAQRVRAARGTFSVSSPPTGPTIVTAELPCGS